MEETTLKARLRTYAPELLDSLKEFTDCWQITCRDVVHVGTVWKNVVGYNNPAVAVDGMTFVIRKPVAEKTRQKRA